MQNHQNIHFLALFFDLEVSPQPSVSMKVKWISKAHLLFTPQTEAVLLLQSKRVNQEKKTAGDPEILKFRI